MSGLVGSFFDRELAFVWEQTVPHYWLTCFSIPIDKLIKEGKRKLARKFSLSYRYTDDLISSVIKDLMNSSLISTPKNLPSLRLQNLLQLLLISTYFLLEMRATTLPPNYMTNVMCLVSTL